jgi:hypothetical protein
MGVEEVVEVVLVALLLEAEEVEADMLPIHEQ